MKYSNKGIGNPNLKNGFVLILYPEVPIMWALHRHKRLRQKALSLRAIEEYRNIRRFAANLISERILDLTS